MAFWHISGQSDAHIYDEESGKHYTYRQLNLDVEAMAVRFNAVKVTKQLIVLFARNNYTSLVTYLAALQSQHCIMLLDADLADEKKSDVIDCYTPHWIAIDGSLTLQHNTPINLDSNLALLLTTSGSTGSAKFVKISYQNIQANAESICNYLPIDKHDTALTSLPIHYSFGLSIVNSHLLTQSNLILSDATPMQSAFWQYFKNNGVNSFYGVPFSYEMIIRLRLERLSLEHIKYYAQAGGRLADDLLSQLVEFASRKHQPVFVMYGQTEATARIAYLSPKKLPAKIGYIGQAIPQGELKLLDSSGCKIKDAHEVGELCYKGPNTCLGLAETLTDLIANTSILTQGWLHTGDLAQFDEDGDFKLVGRLKRIIKITGKRISLDEVQNWLEQHAVCAVNGVDDKLVFFYTKHMLDSQWVTKKLAEYLQVHSRYIQSQFIDELPRLPNGKLDFKKLNCDDQT